MKTVMEENEQLAKQVGDSNVIGIQAGRKEGKRLEVDGAASKEEKREEKVDGGNPRRGRRDQLQGGTRET
jgi:hypothetical protein